jgi:ferredoxin--NADP+ reductase
MAKSDIAPPAADAIARLDLTEIAIIARRGPADVNFTGNELAELGRLASFRVNVEPHALEDVAPPDSDPAPERLRKSRNLEILRGFAGSPPTDGDTRRVLQFRFWHTPVALRGEAGRVRALELADTRAADRRLRLPFDLVVTCIGYEVAPLPGVPSDSRLVANRDGRVLGLPATYVVGWARRGPSGVIPTNRSDAMALVKTIVEDLAATPGADKPGPAGLDKLLAARGVKAVDTAAWRRIETAENAAGQAQGRPRVKAGTWAALERLASG